MGNKEHIIQTAYDAFYAQGYHATGLSYILQKSGLTKGALYHYFHSKEDLLIHVIKQKSQHYLSEYWEIPLRESDTPLKTVKELIKKLPKSSFIQIHHGSFLANMALEVGQLDENINLTLLEAYEYFHDILVNALQRAVYDQELDKATDVKAVASFIISTIDGGLGLSKLHNDSSYYQNNYRILKSYLNSLKA